MCRSLLFLLLAALPVRAELRIPGSTAYGSPNFDGLRVNKERGVTRWTDPKQSVLWFGEFKKPGKVEVSLAVSLPAGVAGDGKPAKFKLTVAGKPAEVTAPAGASGETVLKFGAFDIPKTGYQKFTLESPNPAAAGDITALLLDGPAAEDAHFNTDPRRNAASVHLRYPVEGKPEITAFYCEVTGVEDPVYTYYMATGFSRGYFGMQVNSAQ
jgi:hypothetical protein